MAVKGTKLLKLLEQHQNASTGAAGYKKDFRAFLGLEEGEGDPTLGNSRKAMDAKDISLGDLAHTFLGRHAGASDIKRAFKIAEQFSNMQEAEGSVVLPSQFANISAFTDTVSGLVDALTLEAYLSPEFIGDQLFETQEARVNGGYAIGMGNDGKGGDADLLDGQAYPTVGLKESKVHIPDNQRHGSVIQINEKVFLYDLTGQVQEMAAAAGYSTRRNKEVRQADVALGITNTYERDGVSTNTYITTAGTVPNNYINSSTNVLTDWNAIDRAWQVMSANTDPLTGFEISIPLEGAQILVMPQRRFATQTILQSEWVRQITNSSNEIRQGGMPLPNLTMIPATYIWYNRLIASGVSTTNAPQRWGMGNFKKAFKYRSVIPFQVSDSPLSSEDVRRDIVLVKIAREHGTAWIKEPRFAYQGTSE